MRITRILAGVALAFASLSAFANTYIFAVPPRGSQAATEQVYGPIAKLLSQATGQNIKLIYEADWLSYESDMRAGHFDLVFDGPAFIGWRMAHLNFVPLVKLKGNLVFAVLTSAKNNSIHQVADLYGQTVCAFAPPNIATLTLYGMFPNPMSQPVIVPSSTLKDSYANVISGKCKASILPMSLYQHLNQGATQGLTRIIAKTAPIPNQAFSAGPRIPAAIQQKIRDVLLSPAGAQASQRLRSEFGNRPLVPASADEYQGLGSLLKTVWGFSS